METSAVIVQHVIKLCNMFAEASHFAHSVCPIIYCGLAALMSPSFCETLYETILNQTFTFFSFMHQFALKADHISVMVELMV